MKYLSVIKDTAERDGDIDDLITLIAEGDKYALESLYKETKAAVYGFALSIVRNVRTAEDIMRDTYVKVFSSARNYQPQGKPMAWILGISRDLATTDPEGNPASDVSREMELNAENEDDNFQRTLDQFVLKTALSVLNEEELQIIMLCDVAKIKHSETSATLGSPLPTLLLKYQGALTKLKKNLEELI